MSLYNDFKEIYSVVFKKTISSYIRYLILIPLLIIYAGAYELFSVLLGLTLGTLGAGGGFLSNIITWFVMSFIVSDFLSHIDAVIYNKKIKLSSIGKNSMTYFSGVLSATAIPNIVIYIISMLIRIVIHPYFLFLFYFIYAVPEVIYQKHKDRMDIFTYGHEFLKENWRLWLLPNIIFAFALLGIETFFYNELIYPRLFNMLISGVNINIIRFAAMVMNWVVLSIPLIFFMIFKGYLFKILSVSSRRKREYMRNIYGE
jgi:hypothetical protein